MGNHWSNKTKICGSCNQLGVVQCVDKVDRTPRSNDVA